MPFTHHSHSGQFCGHATNTLEEVVQEAVTRGMEVICMTEHMPRDHLEDLYAEEIAAGITPAQLGALFEAYKIEARRLQSKYRGQISIFVGLETEWIRPPTCNATIERLLSAHNFDMLVGSVHHVHTIPIDFSQELFDKAAAYAAERAGVSASAAERALAADYFDLQFDMLATLRPPVVGHFDLVRLYARFEKRGDSLKLWPDVWSKIERNLALVRNYGGCLEINSAGLRKGLQEPYPCADICKIFLEMDGRFVLSDDSHGIAQVATCYTDALRYVQAVGISELTVFDIDEKRSDERFLASPYRQVSVASILNSRFASLLEGKSEVATGGPG